jgi:hypothetical protein
MDIIETDEAATVRIVRDDDGIYSVERAFGGRWFTAVRDPKPFFADNREGITPLDAARQAFRDIAGY